MRTYFSFGLTLRDIPNSITPQTTLRLLPIPVGLLVLPCTRQCRRSPVTPSPPLFSPVPDRRELQQFALNVHVKHSDLTYTSSERGFIYLVLCLFMFISANDPATATPRRVASTPPHCQTFQTSLILR